MMSDRIKVAFDMWFKAGGPAMFGFEFKSSILESRFKLCRLALDSGGIGDFSESR